jgi:hypothetical protein
LEMGFSWTICWGWPQTAILLISASQVARITGGSHWCLAVRWLLNQDSLEVTHATSIHVPLMRASYTGPHWPQGEMAVQSLTGQPLCRTPVPCGRDHYQGTNTRSDQKRYELLQSLCYLSPNSFRKSEPFYTFSAWGSSLTKMCHTRMQ